ncbi:amidohydrolase family protein [Streptosporangium sp. NPDC002544]|uniref:amidohydrolase family protein n=1 Tax=unclassified Streptosporangium TaxID=2632669 RepID=UPI00332CBA64
MADLPFRYFDCDNHYYEALDAFTRHLEPRFAKRTMQWATINGRTRLLVGGRVNKFIPNPTFDPVAKPGAMDEYFRGRNPKSAGTLELFGELEPIRPEYRDRDARLALMDEQGMQGAIFLPTLGVGMEQALLHDVPALTAAFRAFNRWLAEDWGFAYRERIFAAPYITLVDPDNAVRELEWALERDARFVVMVGGPVMTPGGGRSPADPMFDGFWARANEAGITVLYHGGDSYYSKYLADWGESEFTEAFRASPFRGLASANSLQDTIASMLANRLFERFPRLRIASIEVGSDWVFHLFDKLKKSFGQTPYLYPEDPRETFRRHIWVAPFYEDELGALRDLIGVDKILMGSDYPHVEGLADPGSYIKDLENFQYTVEQSRRVMRDNGLELATRLPA